MSGMGSHRRWIRGIACLFFVGFAMSIDAAESESLPEWSTQELWTRVFLLRDYNTRVVVGGAAMLGFSAGAIGGFTLLRRRALMGDALSHATLPGIGLAFIVASSWGEEKSLGVLLFGGALSGLLGMALILWTRHWTRLKEDAAMGIVLSVFFGGGIAVLGMVQQMASGHAAGLEGFIYGKTASMLATDAWLIAITGAIAGACCVLLFKELKLLCFDQGFAASRGYPVLLLDSILMGCVILVTMIGLQAVGLILMIALLTIPAAAARFWTHQMARMTWLAALGGAVCGAMGAAISAVYPRLPSGAMIVLVAALGFGLSLLFGAKRGVLVHILRSRKLHLAIQRDHVLRGMYELLEVEGTALPEGHTSSAPVAFHSLLTIRSWSTAQLRRALRRAEGEGLVWAESHQARLTPTGIRQAAKLAHDHRLWELYLITHADVAPAHVDRTADAIEHVLTAEMIAELETLLEQREAKRPIPASPHPLERAGRES